MTYMSNVLFVDTRHESASTVGGGEPAVRDDDGPVLRLRLVHHGAARQEARLALHAPLPHAAQVLRQPPGKAALCNITLLGRNPDLLPTAELMKQKRIWFGNCFFPKLRFYAVELR